MAVTEFDTQSSPQVLDDYLGQQGWLQAGERVRNLSRAGEGNMNMVLRVTTNHRSFILKQSRPFVVKYPDIPAPEERIRTEHQFYRAVAGAGIADHLPGILGFDPQGLVLLMEDLGEARDMTFLYAARSMGPEILHTLTGVLGRIHACPVPEDFPDNLELRRLNHQHIFVLPFLEDNGFSLDDVQPGLAELAKPFVRDASLKRTIAALGERYLGKGKTLLHGDYYPGSWLQGAGKAYVIDPEFCFAGFAEFDLGVMAAHLVLISGETGSINTLLEGYAGNADTGLVRQVAGTEIMRRLIGLAQLPLTRSLSEKEHLLETACNLILDENQ